MTIVNYKIIRGKEEEDFTFLTLAELTNETKENENDVVVISKHGLKNSEEFETIGADSKNIEIKNDRLICSIKHADFNNFDMAYCIMVDVSQGSTYDFSYSIYVYRYFNKKLLYTAMSRNIGLGGAVVHALVSESIGSWFET